MVLYMVIMVGLFVTDVGLAAECAYCHWFNLPIKG